MDTSESEPFDDDHDATAETSFTDRLKERAREQWDEAVSHPLLMQMAEGTLSPAVFRAYLVQEYAFVDVSVTVLGYALAHAPSLEEKSHLVRSLYGLTTTQDDFFRRSFKKLDIDPGTWRDPELPGVVDEFKDLMIRAGAHGRYVEPITVMMTAEWLYLTWSRRALREAPRPPEQPLYEEWLKMHVSASFERGVDWLRGQIDRRGPELSREDQRELGELFQRVLELEVEFHDALYRGDPNTDTEP